MKVPNSWLLSYFDKSLECLTLDGNDYRADASGEGGEEIRPSVFQGLVIPLGKLWAD